MISTVEFEKIGQVGNDLGGGHQMSLDEKRTNIRWGVLGTGNVATMFATGLKTLRDAELVAVGSRSERTAHVFANKFGVPKRHSSYKLLALDPDIDVVYIATPHSLHKENALLCLEAGKAVLCEKPFCINAKEAAEVIGLARKRRLFLMEAMWTRFLPLLVKLRQLLHDGAIGEVRMLTGDFGFGAKFDPRGRLFNPALGGGALLDVGVYPISLSSMIFGKPSGITSMAHLGQTGVDEQAAIILRHYEGRLSVVWTAIRISTPQEAVIMGTEGRIKLHSPWWKGTKMTLCVRGKTDEVIELSFDGNGYNYEAAEVMRCLRAGRLESEIMPLDETLSIMETMDQIRKQWELRYPME